MSAYHPSITDEAQRVLEEIRVGLFLMPSFRDKLSIILWVDGKLASYNQIVRNRLLALVIKALPSIPGIATKRPDLLLLAAGALHNTFVGNRFVLSMHVNGINQCMLNAIELDSLFNLASDGRQIRFLINLDESGDLSFVRIDDDSVKLSLAEVVGYLERIDVKEADPDKVAEFKKRMQRIDFSLLSSPDSVTSFAKVILERFDAKLRQILI